MSAFLKQRDSAVMQVPMTYQRLNLMLMLTVFCSWSDYQSLSELTLFFFFFIENVLLIIILLNVPVSIQVRFARGKPIYFVSYTLFRERYSLTGNDQFCYKGTMYYYNIELTKVNSL